MQSTFASMSMSASQNDYNTASHKGLQSHYSIPTTVPAPQEPSIKRPLSEPLPLSTRWPVQESKNPKSSDPIDSKPIRRYRDTTTEPTKTEKHEAEALKSLGNAEMGKKDYPKAIDLYTKALAITPGAAVYLSNRAAAHFSSKNYAAACADAEAAVAADPKYAEAWVRLAAARLVLGDARGSVDAYTEGIEYEGHGGGEGTRKGLEAAKKKLKQLEEDDSVIEEKYSKQIANLINARIKLNWREKYFIPQKDLHAIMSQNVIEHLVDKDESLKELEGSGAANGTLFDKKLFISDVTNSHKRLLALCVHEGLPLICLWQMLYPKEKAVQFPETPLKDSDRPAAADRIQFRTILLKQWFFNAYQFPKPTDATIHCIDLRDNDVLPIEKCGGELTPIGQGGSKVVYKVRIQPGDHRFTAVCITSMFAQFRVVLMMCG
jgi:tetratricopeptide (TPR) repeat protein